VPPRRWIIALVLALGCREEALPSDARVTIESELVEQVCRGTIVHAESELTRIEAELELAPMSEQVEIHVVDPERIGEWCPEGDSLCVLQPPRRLYVSSGIFDRVLTRELVRDRLARSPVGSTKPLFSEGIAVALTRPMCTAYPSWEPPPANTVLGQTLGTSFDNEELYLAGELLRWLLDTHGVDAVLEFMVTLARSDTPDEVRLAYLERFGSAIDIDLYAHWRPAEARLQPERAGCVAPEAPRDEARSRVLLNTTFDCDSSAVRNDFANSNQVFVEWTLTIDEHSDGIYYPDGELPEGVKLTISSCECEHGSWTNYPPDYVFGVGEQSFAERQRLYAGSVYRLRASGPIGSSLDLELIGPCDYALQNCPAGQQCAPGGYCVDAVEDPGEHGDSCWPVFGLTEAPLPCEVGLVCLGPYEGTGAGLCLPYCGEDSDGSCPGTLSCESLEVCTEACDPFMPVCEQDWSCVPNLQTGGGGCHPFPDANLGLLESCSTFGFQCGPGLVCENHVEVDGCHGDGWIDFSGCCTPICDPAAADPGCPPELPNCGVEDEDVLGTCQP
jgi:hypothetical protein